jgi:hypothetical protein
LFGASRYASLWEISTAVRATAFALRCVNIYQDDSGEEILTFAPVKAYQSIVFSSPELVNGATYTVAYGGTSTGTATDGLYQDGTYSAGTEYTSFTVAAVVTTIGNTGRR